MFVNYLINYNSKVERLFLYLGSIYFASKIMKKNYLIIVLMLSIVAVVPIYWFNNTLLERAIDSVVVQRGREDRQETLERLTVWVEKTLLLDEPQRLLFLEILKQDLSVYNSNYTQDFLVDQLSTITSIRSVSLDKILDGWPWKDGIPALTNPKFVSYEVAQDQGTIREELEWISVTSKDGLDARFYPFSILNRHEIINDTIDTRDIMVTYCPLCATAIVYNRRIDNQILEFKVSWKLYQSNLLMYDTKTESLWSQAFGRAKVWDYTDYMLEYIPSQQLTVKQFILKYPNWRVLSSENWYNRNYQIDSPYGEYDQNDELLFPVDEYSSSLASKTLMVVVNDKRGFSAAFDRKKLMKIWAASLIASEGITLTAFVEEGGIIVVEDRDIIIPHFSEMWFSWSNRNQWSDLWWSGE